MKNIDRKKRFNEEVEQMKCNEQLVCDYCKGKGRRYVGVTLGHMKCPVCGKP